MDIFRDLYQQLIIDHNKNPRNYHEMENASHRADGHNPLCGDEMTVFINFIISFNVVDVCFFLFKLICKYNKFKI